MAKNDPLSPQEKFDKHRQEELQKELQEIKDKKLTQEAKTRKPIEDSLRDKAVAQQEGFTAKGKKESGMSTGYVAKETTSDETFILKQFYKNVKDCKTNQDKTNRNDNVQEFIGAAMYQFLLYDRAPKEQLVVPDKDNPKSLYVRSKFFKDVEQMSVFSGGTAGGKLNPSSPKLKDVEGFEKVMAACHVLGENDYHAGNFMVQKGKTLTKIDHGKSFSEFHQDFGSMVNSTTENFHSFGYDQAIKNGNLTFSAEKYADSLKQMVSQFDEKQIDAIVDQRVDELKKAGLDPKGLAANPRADYIIPIDNFDELRNVYKNLIKQNINNMKEISRQVDVVAKFDLGGKVDEKFKNGGWVKAFDKSPEKDPVQYAIQHNIKIEGKEAAQWAKDNKYYEKPTEKKAVEENINWVKKDGKWQDKEALDKEKEAAPKIEKVANSINDLATEFIDKNKGSKEISTEKVEKLYDQVLKKLEQAGYIQKEDIDKLKTGSLSDFSKNVKETQELLKGTKVELSFGDKLKHGMAKFCKKIGCKQVSENLMKKISEEGKGKIHTAELAASTAVKNIAQTLSENKNVKAVVTKSTELTDQKIAARKQPKGPER